MESKKINQLATEMAPASTDLTIIGDPITGVSKKVTLEQISSLFSSSISFYTNYASFPATGSIDTLYCAKDTNKLYLWSGSAYVETFPSQDLLDTYQLRSEKGNANGYASLDGSGKVPSTQLPSYVDDVIEVANYASLPVTGETGKIYITLDNNKIYRWSGSVYVEIASNNAIWGSITGTLSNQTDLQNALNAKVPYTGATANVNLGTFDLTADIITGATGSFASSGGSDTFAINHSSGSGIALNITKGGNGEGLYINKTSGSGNAATIIGTLNATTLVKNGGTSSQFLKADGSVDSSTYITLTSLSATSPLSYNNTTGAFSISKADDIRDGYISSADWTTFNNKQNALTNPITGTGASGRIAYFNGTTTQTSSANLTWDNTDSILSTKSILATTDVSAYNLTINNEDVGKIQNVTDRSWSLAYSSGGSANALGNSALVWNYLGNVIVINKLSVGNYNTTYNLDITGTARFTGQLTLGSTITNGTNTYTLPSATGTLALSSDLTSYVPTSRTLTINGTTYDLSANRSWTIAAGISGSGTTNYVPKFTSGTAIGNSLIFDDGTNVGIGTATPSVLLDLYKASYPVLQISSGTVTGNIGIDTGSNFMNVGTSTNHALQFATNNTARLIIASTGVATFSQKVQVTGSTSPSSGSGLELFYDGSYAGILGYNRTSSAYLPVAVDGSTVTLFTSSSPRLTIASTGAATFSSSVQSTQLTINSGASNNYINFVQNTTNIGYVGDANWIFGGTISDFGIRATNNLVFGIGATERMRITSGGNVGIGTTSPSASLHIIRALGSNVIAIGETGSNTRFAIGQEASYTGNYIDSTNIDLKLMSNLAGGSGGNIILLTGSNGTNVERMRITSGGNVGIGTSAPDDKLHVVTNGTTAYGSMHLTNSNSEASLYLGVGGSSVANTALRNRAYVMNSTASDLVLGTSDAARVIIRDDGYIRFPDTYSGFTSGAAANMYMFTDGGIYRSTSSIKYKKNVQDYTKGLAEVMQLRPVSYEGKGDIDIDKHFAGLIAEEVHDLGLTEFVQYAEDGTPDALAYSNMVSLLVKAIQEQQQQIEELKAKIK